MLESLSMVQDGRRLAAIAQGFVNSFLDQFYSVKVSDDMDLVAFWKIANCCATSGSGGSDSRGARKCGFPELTFEPLAAYLVHFIFACRQAMNVGLPTTGYYRLLCAMGGPLPRRGQEEEDFWKLRGSTHS